MPRIVLVPPLLCSLLLSALPALADPAYSAKSVADFLVRSQPAPKTRGICIGTAEDCRRRTRPEGLDMLISFDLDSAALTPQARENLDEIAAALKDERLSAASFVVEGYTDASGSERYNDDLSRRRAASVANFLLARGVSPDRLTATGFGERSPRVPDPYDARNRRVEMRINVQ